MSRWQFDRADIFDERGWECEVCGAPLTSGVPQLAHRIPKSKCNLARYGAGVIHHPLNMAAVCSLECNQAVNIGNRPAQVHDLLEAIKSTTE